MEKFECITCHRLALFVHAFVREQEDSGGDGVLTAHEDVDALPTSFKLGKQAHWDATSTLFDDVVRGISKSEHGPSDRDALQSAADDVRQDTSATHSASTD